jgi:hypothetical protein
MSQTQATFNKLNFQMKSKPESPTTASTSADCLESCMSGTKSTSAKTESARKEEHEKFGEWLPKEVADDLSSAADENEVDDIYDALPSDLRNINKSVVTSKVSAKLQPVHRAQIC